MNKQNLNRRGFLLIDVIVTVSLLTMLLVVLGFAMTASQKLNKYNMVKQRCLAACEGQMDSIAVRGKVIDKETMKRLWKDVEVTVEKTAGNGQWKGLELVKVNALSKAGNKTIKMSIERYISDDAGEQEDDNKANGIIDKAEKNAKDSSEEVNDA